MGWPEGFFTDGQRPLVQRLGLRILALGFIQKSQIVQG